MSEIKFIYENKINIGTNSKTLLRKFNRPSTLISLGLLFLIIFCALFASILAPTNPYDLKVVSILDSRLSPGDKMLNGTVAWLGTDGAGRDVIHGPPRRLERHVRRVPARIFGRRCR